MPLFEQLVSVTPASPAKQTAAAGNSRNASPLRSVDTHRPQRGNNGRGN